MADARRSLIELICKATAKTVFKKETSRKLLPREGTAGKTHEAKGEQEDFNDHSLAGSHRNPGGLSRVAGELSPLSHRLRTAPRAAPGPPSSTPRQGPTRRAAGQVPTSPPRAKEPRDPSRRAVFCREPRGPAEPSS